MSDWVIEIKDLRKSFKGQRALDGLDLSVPAGSIFGFLGRNGAGKTTTIKTLMNFLRPDSGTVRVFGLPVGDANGIEIRRRIGFVTEEKELYPYMNVEQIIRFTRGFFPRWRAEETLFEVFRSSTEEIHPGSFEGYAIEAHALTCNLPGRRSPDPG